MAKHWVRIEYPTNPHPVEPYDAYQAVVRTVADKQGAVDEMLFDRARKAASNTSSSRLERQRDSKTSSAPSRPPTTLPELLQGDLMTLAELPPPSSAE